MYLRLLHLITLILFVLYAAAPEPAAGQPSELSTASPLSSPGLQLAGLLENAVQVAAGDYFTCVLTSAGGVLCWGYNGIYSLGNGSTTGENSGVPVQVVGLTSGVKAITAGSQHACALLISGAVWCWGDNRYSQLGDGSGFNSAVPVQVVNLAGEVTGIAAGMNHTCALLVDGSVQCWGDNNYGQLGDGSDISKTFPETFALLSSGATAISAGANYSCALLDTQLVQCWGDNRYGQLGNGQLTGNLNPNPVDVSTISGVIAVASGKYIGEYNCALLETGEAWCWGRNSRGQLGDGTTADSWVPVQVLNLAGPATAIAPGEYHTCAILDTGEVQCWGDNNSGQLGDGTVITPSPPVPLTVELQVAAVSIASGQFHTCAVLAGGQVKCWGDNFDSQLGNGYFDNNPLPLQVPSLSAVIPAAGSDFTCAVSASGGLFCWGNNFYGQLGSDVPIVSPDPLPVGELAAGVQDVQLGVHHTCALAGGGAQCWGWNIAGQLGDGTNVDRPIPAPVNGLSQGVTAIAAGAFHNCALLQDGGIQCWGSNQLGQLGDPDLQASSSPVPVPVGGLNGTAAAVSAGYNHTCALLQDGSIWCWGDNQYGQLGNGSAWTGANPLPSPVSGLNGTATAVAASDDHTCAVVDGTVKCWGRNHYGQLGNGTVSYDPNPLPITVPGLAGITAVDTGGNTSCAILSTGALKCWGFNYNGEVGNGSISFEQTTPDQVVGLTGGVSRVSVGTNHTCASLTSGAMYCWGSNFYGELGQGTYSSSYFPVSVVAAFANPLTLFSITPGQGRNDLPVRVIIKGANILPGASAVLDFALPSDLPVQLENELVLDENTLAATVPAGVLPGLYTLSVTNPDGSKDLLPDAYTVLDASTLDDLYATELDIDLQPNTVYFPPGETIFDLQLVVRRMGGLEPLPDFTVEFFQGSKNLGTATVTGLGPDSSKVSTSVPWTPDAAGPVTLTAVINAPAGMEETNKNNNTVSRTVFVVPNLGDVTPPVVEKVFLSPPGDFTPERGLTITASAFDEGMGVKNLLFMEYAFNQASKSFEVVQTSGWVDYLSAVEGYPWMLSPTPGAHYIQVWAADRAGNISDIPGMALINYLVSSDSLAAGEVRIYRQFLDAGQSVSLALTTLSGSADMAAWRLLPDEMKMGESENQPSPEVISFTADAVGVYQYEIFGMASGTTVSLDVRLSQPAALPHGNRQLLARTSPYSNSVPADDGTGGVPSAPGGGYPLFLPAVMR